MSALRTTGGLLTVASRESTSGSLVSRACCLRCPSDWVKALASALAAAPSSSSLRAGAVAKRSATDCRDCTSAMRRSESA